MSQTKIYLDISEDIKKLLNENDIIISDVLHQHNIEHRVTYGVLPDYNPDEGRDKELVTIILASSAAIASIGFTISAIIKTLQQKPHFLEYDELVELKDDKGKILLDKEGNPRFKRVKKIEYIEPRKEDTDRLFEFRWNSVDGIIVKLGFATKQLDSNNPGS